MAEFTPAQPYYDEDSVVIEHVRDWSPGAEEKLFAELLVQLGSFHQELLEIRRNLGLTKFYEYPAANTQSALFDFSRSLGSTLANQAAKYAQELASRYRLSVNWLSPLRTAILTNHLPVPDDTPIKLIIPAPDSGLAALSRKIQLELLTDSDSLVIVVSRSMTPNKLRKAMNEPEAVKALRQLPSLPSPKTDRAVLVWGQVGWLLKEDYPDESWPDRLDRLEKLVSDSDGLPKLPLTADDFTSYYQRYLSAIRDLSKSKS